MSTLRETLLDLKNSLAERPDELMQEVGAGGEVLAARLRVAISLALLALPGLHYYRGGGARESFLGLLGATAFLLLSQLWLGFAQQQRRPHWLPFVSATCDVLLVGLLLVVGGRHGSADADAWLAWGGYPLAIVATALRNDARVTLLAGGLALTQTLLLSWLPLATASPGSPAIQLILLSLLTLVSAVLVFRSQRLLQMAGSDGLTGLPNRSYLTHRVPQLIAEARAAGETLTLALIDLDHFRRINEDYGHLVGDRALRHAVGILRLELGREEPLMRVGGEEFVLILHQPIGAAWERIDVLRQALESHPFQPQVGAEPVRITLSAGLACMPQDANHLSELMKRADQRLGLAKAQGRNRVMARDGG